MEAIDVHVCDLANSGSGTDQLIFRFCENKDDLEGSPADVRNNPKCCVTNRFGYYNMMTQSSTSSYFERNKWKMIDGFTGDKLGQCEGFEIKGPKIFMSGKEPFKYKVSMIFVASWELPVGFWGFLGT